VLLLVRLVLVLLLVLGLQGRPRDQSHLLVQQQLLVLAHCCWGCHQSASPP
jgi:hypothetical protein